MTEEEISKQVKLLRSVVEPMKPRTINALFEVLDAVREELPSGLRSGDEVSNTMGLLVKMAAITLDARTMGLYTQFIALGSVQGGASALSYFTKPETLEAQLETALALLNRVTRSEVLLDTKAATESRQ